MSELDERQGLDPVPVGERLRIAREAAGLTLAEVALRTRIPTRHLQTIETGAHDGLPSITYSTGFVKTFAKIVGLDDATLSRDWRDEAGRMEQVRYRPEPFAPADPARTPTRGLAIVTLVLALLVGLGYLYWRGLQNGQADRDKLAASAIEQPAPAVAPGIAPSVMQPQAAAPTTAGPVAIEAVEQVWLKVYEMNGPTLFMGLLEPGKRFDVPSTAVDPRIFTGRPGAIRVLVGTTVAPPLGDPKKTIKDVSLKADRLLAAPSAAATQDAAAPSVAASDNTATP